MYSKLLVPLDGSKVSEAILPYARTLAKGLKIPAEFLHVIDPDLVETLSRRRVGRSVDAVEAEMKRANTEYLSAIAKTFPGSATTHTSVELGNPPEVIVDRGAQEKGILIAMSTHGRSGVKRWYLGSVTDKVLHASNDPLLIVRGTESGQSTQEAPLKKVLVPLDGSPLAEEVLPHISAMAKGLKLDVELVRAYSIATYTFRDEYYDDLVPSNIERLTDDLRDEAKEYLEAKASQLKGEGLQQASLKLLEGEAAESIIDHAQKTPDNMVAMCTHGRSGIKRWMLGSITDRVVCHCGDPVLVICPSTPKP